MVAVFAIKLMTGIALMWLLMPRREVTDGFFRIQMLVVLGLSVLTAVSVDFATLGVYTVSDASPDEVSRATRRIEMLRWGTIVIAVTTYAGHIFWKLGRRTPGTLSIVTVAVLSTVVLIVRAVSAVSDMPAWLLIASDLATSSVLAAMLTGMLLGHWYLTTPTMSIRPLFWFAEALLIAGIVRLSVSCAAWAHNGWPSQDRTHGLWLTMRLIGGVAVPIIVAVMVFRILRFRNTQSATGVLFAGLILVFMGEMAAALLERDGGIPY